MAQLVVDKYGHVWARVGPPELFRCVTDEDHDMTPEGLAEHYGPLADYETGEPITPEA